MTSLVHRASCVRETCFVTFANAPESLYLLCAVDCHLDVYLVGSLLSSSATSSTLASSSALDQRRKRRRAAATTTSAAQSREPERLDGIELIESVQFDDSIDALVPVRGGGAGGSSVDLVCVSLANDELLLLALDERSSDASLAHAHRRLTIVWRCVDERLQRRASDEAKLVRAHANDRLVGLLLDNTRFVALFVVPPSNDDATTTTTSSSSSTATNATSSATWTVLLGVAPLQYVSARDFCWFRPRLAAAAAAAASASAGDNATGANNVVANSSGVSLSSSTAVPMSESTRALPSVAFMFGVLHGSGGDALALELCRVICSPSTMSLVVAPSTFAVALPPLTLSLTGALLFSRVTDPFKTNASLLELGDELVCVAANEWHFVALSTAVGSGVDAARVALSQVPLRVFGFISCRFIRIVAQRTTTTMTLDDATLLVDAVDTRRCAVMTISPLLTL